MIRLANISSFEALMSSCPVENKKHTDSRSERNHDKDDTDSEPKKRGFWDGVDWSGAAAQLGTWALSAPFLLAACAGVDKVKDFVNEPTDRPAVTVQDPVPEQPADTDKDLTPAERSRLPTALLAEDRSYRSLDEAQRASQQAEQEDRCSADEAVQTALIAQ